MDGNDRSIAGQLLELTAEALAEEFPGRQRLRNDNLGGDAGDFGLQLIDDQRSVGRRRIAVVGKANRLDLDRGILARRDMDPASLGPSGQIVPRVDPKRRKPFRVGLLRGGGKVRVTETFGQPQNDSCAGEAGVAQVSGDDLRV